MSKNQLRVIAGGKSGFGNLSFVRIQNGRICLNSNNGGRGRTRTCDPALIKRML